MTDEEREQELHKAIRAIGEACALAGYASTCRIQNRREWMDGLGACINRFNAAIGDGDRVAFDGRDSFVVSRES